MSSKSFKIISNNLPRVARVTLFFLVIFFTFSSTIACLPASAVLRQHHETPGNLRYHARDSIKDRQGNAWQVILFPERQNSSVNKYYLRLVGFPGIVSFTHPQPLEIITSEGKIVTATDVYAQSAPADNVGQYDVTKIISKLPQKDSLKLTVALKNNRDLSLKITPEILLEWQLLVREIEL